VAISVVGGNDEIATSFCGRTRNDRSSFDKLRMSGQRVAQDEQEEKLKNQRPKVKVDYSDFPFVSF
jgi:hypothetical protein